MTTRLIGDINIPSNLVLPSGFNKVTLLGEQLIDYLWITNKVLTNAEILETEPYNYIPSWTPDTIFLANFDDTLQAGSIKTLNENIIKWLIYRKKNGNTSLDLVASIDAVHDFIMDYSVGNQTGYQYYIFPLTQNTIVSPIISDTITTDWWNWSLVDIEESTTKDLFYVNTDNIWNFELNIESGAMTQNLDKQTYVGFSQFPKVSTGNRDYYTGSLSCLIGKITNNVYIDTIDTQESFRKFIKNGKQKLLKDRKGNAFLVDTTGNSFDVTDTLSEQVVAISFNWMQIGTIDDISIIEEKGAVV